MLQVLRDTAMARRTSRKARLAASVVASVATLVLVTGMAPVYADDSTAGATDTTATTTDPATDATTDPTGTGSGTPDGTDAATDAAATQTQTTDPGLTDPSTSAPEVTTTDTSTDTSTTPAPSGDKTSTTTNKKTTTSTTTSSPTLAQAVTLLAAAAPADPDWIWQGSAPTLDDGEKDATAYGSGSSEDKDPATWSLATADTPKADLLKYYFNVDDTGDIVVSFGFTRKATTGDTAFAAEFNQAPNSSDTPPRPVRTPGDLLLKFHVDSGSSPLEFVHAFIWKSVDDFAAHEATPGNGSCEERYDSGFGWCEIPRDGFQGRVSDDGYTAEGRVDLTTLFDLQGCSAVFNEVNLRGESSAENWTNSLQDYLPLPGASVPSTCATLVINKYRAGSTDKLSGARFDVYAGATATGTPIYDDIADGSPADTDGAGNGSITLTGLEPGTYTVKEVAAPGSGTADPDDDYFLASPDTISHTVAKSGTVSFDFYDVKKWQALSITKDGSGSYDASYDWSIDKGVAGSESATSFGSSLTRNVPDDGDGTTSADFGYQVTVTQGARHTSNIVVTGNLRVANPNNEPVLVDLSDTLTGATCNVTGGADDRTAAANTTTSFGYTCTYPAGTLPTDFDTTNNGSASWDKSDYPQTSGDIGVAGSYSAGTGDTTIGYTEHATNKTVTITDDHHTWDPAWTITWTAQGTQQSRTYTRSISAAAGTCTEETNRADVMSRTSSLAHDSATAKVCVGKDLDVSKVSAESLTRTYLWTIDKVNTDDDPLFTDPATGKVTTHWDVTVSANGKQDTGWQMTGTITVTNPNDWEDVTLTGLTDTYSGGGTCDVDDWATMTAGDKTIDRSSSKEFGYTCTFATEPSYDGTNTAVATWDQAAAHTPATTGDDIGGQDSFLLPIQESDWTLDAEHNKQVTVTDGVIGNGDPGQIGTTYTWSDGFTTTIHYTADLGAPPGECRTWTNTATLHGDAGAQLGEPVSDTVEVCNAQALTLDKTTAGHFDRTYHWSLDKSVSADPASDPDGWGTSDTFTGDSYSHTFGYRVLLSQLPWTDADFTITGVITLTNPNSDATIPAISSTVTDAPEVGADASCVIDDEDLGDDNGAALVGYQTAPIPSGGHLDISYLCTVGQLAPAQYTGGTNVLTATNASNSPLEKAVTFTKAGEIDKDVTVFDNKVDLGTPATLGSFSYDEAHPAMTYAMDYTLALTADDTACQDFPNLAAVFGDDAMAPLDTATATATVCPDPGTWTVSKTSDVGDGAVPVDSDVTYTLTAHKTGGVDPEDVVIQDDLSDLAPYVALPTQADLDAAAPAGSTATIAGNVITWTIADLGATDATLDFTVHVNADAYGVDLPNLVTSDGSDNCPTVEAAQGQDECTTDNDTPHYTLAKSSVPGSGSTVAPGDEITYTLTVHNDSDAPINGTTMPGAAVTDDLSRVVDNATLDVSSITGPGTATYDEESGELTWVLPSIAAGATVTLEYTVTVDAGEWGETLRNVATEGPGGDCVVSCTTTSYTPHYTLTKSSDPASGSTVAPGDQVTYSLTVHNDGPVTLTGAQVEDNLSSVVDDATLDESSITGPGSASYDDASGKLTWNVPDVAVGGTVVLTYTVTINADEWGQTLTNVATPDQSGDCLVSCTTTSYTPHYTLTKSSDPASGSTVAPGDQVTYSLTVHNDGPVTLTGAQVEDNLSSVVDDATLDESSITGPGSASYDDASGKLTWNVPDVAVGGTVVLTYTVTINADEWGQTLTNVATPDQSGDCLGSCTTTSYTPHYTLQKTSDAGETVMPPYLGDAGTTITYTLTVHNDGPVPLTDATVTDNLADVLDNASFVEGSIDPAGQASVTGSTLSWNVPDVDVDGTATLSYRVTVDAGQWDQTLTNTATPSSSGDCVTTDGCTTTTDTPPVTQMQVKKVNAETGAGLAGAGFTLYQDNAPFAEAGAPSVGPEDEQIGTATSDAEGLATFAAQLRPGRFLVRETTAPEGYSLPAEGDTMLRVVDDGNFVAGGVMAPFEFRDPAEGQLAIVAKRQFERDPLTGLWVPSDGKVDYGDDVRYVVQVSAEGPKLFHDVLVTDYVPGFNPADTTSTAKASLVPGTALCTGGLVCTVTEANGLVTWAMGTVTDASGTVEMVVHFPDLPNPVPYVNGEFTTTLWNVGYLDWDEAVFTTTPQLPVAFAGARAGGFAAAAEGDLEMAHHQLTSNEVIVSATATQFFPPLAPPAPPAPPQGGPTPPQTLPNTGGPQAWLPLTGLGLLVLGAALALGDRRRRRAA